MKNIRWQYILLMSLVGSSLSTVALNIKFINDTAYAIKVVPSLTEEKEPGKQYLPVTIPAGSNKTFNNQDLKQIKNYTISYRPSEGYFAPVMLSFSPFIIDQSTIQEFVDRKLQAIQKSGYRAAGRHTNTLSIKLGARYDIGIDRIKLIIENEERITI